MGLGRDVGRGMNEWDGTPWGGTVIDPVARPAGPPWNAAQVVAKAATGWQSSYNGTNVPISELRRSPLKIMREAQALYWTNPWIGSAEDAVTRQVAGRPWHVEDDQDTVDDDSGNPAMRAIMDLLEKPQAALPEDERQIGYETWTDMIAITSRHMGLCSVGYWYLDQVDRYGIPLAILYVNPARLFPVVTRLGRLTGYILDPQDDQGRGGTPLLRNQILPFFLRPPDFGALPKGLVERAALKAGITSMADRHAMDTLGTGGRIAGLVSPKEGYIDDPERFLQLERDFRSVNESPDAAKRMTIIRGPVDFHQTAADPDKLQLIDLSKMNRDDIFAIWGVPPTQAGVPGPGGLNSGETRKYDYQTLMQGPVHDRVNVIRSTIQLKLLDRWNAVGLKPQLDIEEPDFDDDSVPYALAEKASGQPLTANERRSILKLDPLPDYGPDGSPLGLAIILPTTLSTFGQGGEPGAPEGNPFGKSKPIPQPTIGTGYPSPAPIVAKAGPFRRDAKVIPAIKTSVASVLSAQKAAVAAKVRARGVPKKPESVWDTPGENARLAKALRPHMAGIAQAVTARARTMFAAKADPFDERIEAELVTRSATRIVGINATTRDAVVAALRLGLESQETAQDVAARIEALPAFDEARAELVARTETMFAYNTAALESYREYGVEMVEAVDGDEDEECAARVAHGPYTLAEAMDIEDHPNGTLDWVPA